MQLRMDLEEKKRLAKAKLEAMIKPKAAEPEAKNADPDVDLANVEDIHTTDKPKENELIKLSTSKLRPVYSRVDINCDKWLLTMDEASKAKLETPPSLTDGIDAQTEADLRFLGCELIQSGSILLKLPQTAAATGQILFQRFYYQKSFITYMFEHTVMACLSLASKIEEAPRRPRDIYNVFCRLEQLHRIRQSGRPITKEATAKLKPRPIDITYLNAKNNMRKAELRLLSTLGFVVHVKHPHKLICSYIFILNQNHRTDLIQKAWSYMNDGLRTDMFVRFTPETIACACIFLAARTVEPAIPLPTSPFHWFELFDASDRDVEAIALMLQALYTRPRAPNMARLVGVLEAIRDKRALEDNTKKALAKAKELTDKNAKDSKENEREKDDKEKEKERRRTRSRSRSPRNQRRRRDSPDRDRSKRRGGGGGGRRDDRRDDRGHGRDEKRRRSRSRERERVDRDKEQRKIREREVYQSLGRKYHKDSSSPVISKIRK